MELDLTGEDAQCAAYQPRGSIGMSASAAAVDQGGQPTCLFNQSIIGAAVREFVDAFSQAWQPVAARAALLCALSTEVLGYLCCADESALRQVQRVDDPCAG